MRRHLKFVLKNHSWQVTLHAIKAKNKIKKHLTFVYKLAKQTNDKLRLYQNSDENESVWRTITNKAANCCSADSQWGQVTICWGQSWTDVKTSKRKQSGHGEFVETKWGNISKKKPKCIMMQRCERTSEQTIKASKKVESICRSSEFYWTIAQFSERWQARFPSQMKISQRSWKS